MNGRLWKGLVAVGAATLALAPSGAGVISHVWGREVLLISPHRPEIVAMNRALWRPGEPVAEIYGLPSDRPVRALFVKEERLIRPAEDSSLALLPARPVPLQAGAVWFTAKLAAGIGLCLVLLGLVVRRFRHAAR